MTHETTRTFLNGTPQSAPLQPTSLDTDQSSEVRPTIEAKATPKAKRRTFSAQYKRRIVQEADQATKPGEVGALLRREGLYSSHLADWRKQDAAGHLATKRNPKRGRRPKQTPQEKEIGRLKREVARLEQRLAQAELVIDAQKKVAELLDLVSQQRGAK